MEDTERYLLGILQTKIRQMFFFLPSRLQQVVFHFVAPFGELGSLSSPKLKRLWKTAYLLCISYKLVAQMPK